MAPLCYFSATVHMRNAVTARQRLLVVAGYVLLARMSLVHHFTTPPVWPPACSLAELVQKLLEDEDGSRGAEDDERLASEQAEDGPREGRAQKTLHHTLRKRYHFNPVDTRNIATDSSKILNETSILTRRKLFFFGIVAICFGASLKMK